MRRFPQNDIISLVGEAPRYDLAESIGPDLRLAEILDGTTLGDLPLAYGSAQGDSHLRRLIADRHGVAPDDVVVTVGGMHAVFLIAFVLCDRGEEAVTVSPTFPLARNALDAVGARVRTVPASFARGYQLDAADVARELSEQTRLVSLTSPQNPSGVALSPKVVADVVALMEERCPEAYLLIDETYREAVYGNDAPAPSAVGRGERVISSGSLSKCHGAPGLRVGWAITRDPALRRELIAGKFNTVVTCSPLDERLARNVLERQEGIIDERRRRLADGLARTERWVRANDAFVEWVRPDAGAICCVRLKPSVVDDATVGRFYEEIAREGVRVANGTWFGDEARVFRLGFGLLPASDLEAALDGLTRALARLSGATS